MLKGRGRSTLRQAQGERMRIGSEGADEDGLPLLREQEKGAGMGDGVAGNEGVEQWSQAFGGAVI